MKDTAHVMRKIGRFLERSHFTYKEAALGCLSTVSRLMDANKSQDLAAYQDYYNKITDLRIAIASEGVLNFTSFVKALCEAAIDIINMDMS